jgi:hypothetical protein
MPGDSRPQPRPRSKSWLTHGLTLAGAVAAAFLAVQCGGDLDVCAPTQARLGFFSKGDCLVTRASFFQGHEWLTWLGNRDLPGGERFTDEEARVIAEGNRRVDWPQELLIHLNNGVPAYVFALTAYTERPENQRFHFLLDDRNDTAGAFAQARQELERLTLQAAELWPSERVRALTSIGRAQHLIQDSFSEAHSVREPEHSESAWCVRTIKAYIERDEAFDTSDILYHGVEDDEDGVTIGHVTPQDSLYRPGRDCHEPSEQADVERCLSASAKRARLASRDHLAAVGRIVQARAEDEALRELVITELAGFTEQHLELCP